MSSQVICAVALLYQKKISAGFNNRVQCVMVPGKVDSDEYYLKAKAEKYVNEHEELAKNIKGFHVVAWHCATLLEPDMFLSTEKD